MFRESSLKNITINEVSSNNVLNVYIIISNHDELTILHNAWWCTWMSMFLSISIYWLMLLLYRSALWMYKLVNVIILWSVVNLCISSMLSCIWSRQHDTTHCSTCRTVQWRDTGLSKCNQKSASMFCISTMVVADGKLEVAAVIQKIWRRGMLRFVICYWFVRFTLTFNVYCLKIYRLK